MEAVSTLSTTALDFARNTSSLLWAPARTPEPKEENPRPYVEGEDIRTTLYRGATRSVLLVLVTHCFITSEAHGARGPEWLSFCGSQLAILSPIARAAVIRTLMVKPYASGPAEMFPPGVQEYCEYVRLSSDLERRRAVEGDSVLEGGGEPTLEEVSPPPYPPGWYMYGGRPEEPSQAAQALEAALGTASAAVTVASDVAVGAAGAIVSVVGGVSSVVSGATTGIIGAGGAVVGAVSSLFGGRDNSKGNLEGSSLPPGTGAPPTYSFGGSSGEEEGRALGASATTRMSDPPPLRKVRLADAAVASPGANPVEVKATSLQSQGLFKIMPRGQQACLGAYLNGYWVLPSPSSSMDFGSSHRGVLRSTTVPPVVGWCFPSTEGCMHPVHVVPMEAFRDPREAFACAGRIHSLRIAGDLVRTVGSGLWDYASPESVPTVIHGPGSSRLGGAEVVSDVTEPRSDSGSDSDVEATAATVHHQVYNGSLGDHESGTKISSNALSCGCGQPGMAPLSGVSCGVQDLPGILMLPGVSTRRQLRGVLASIVHLRVSGNAAAIPMKMISDPQGGLKNLLWVSAPAEWSGLPGLLEFPAKAEARRLGRNFVSHLHLYKEALAAIVSARSRHITSPSLPVLSPDLGPSSPLGNDEGLLGRRLREPSRMMAVVEESRDDGVTKADQTVSRLDAPTIHRGGLCLWIQATLEPRPHGNKILRHPNSNERETLDGAPGDGEGKDGWGMGVVRLGVSVKGKTPSAYEYSITGTTTTTTSTRSGGTVPRKAVKRGLEVSRKQRSSMPILIANGDWEWLSRILLPFGCVPIGEDPVVTGTSDDPSQREDSAVSAAMGLLGPQAQVVGAPIVLCSPPLSSFNRPSPSAFPIPGAVPSTAAALSAKGHSSCQIFQGIASPDYSSPTGVSSSSSTSRSGA